MADKSKLSQFEGVGSAIVKGVSSIIVAVGVIYGGIEFVDYRIEKVLADPQMIRRIATSTRPEMIVDSKGTVLFDRGAMDQIADIRVTADSKFPEIVRTVTITPKNFMALPPLVTAVDGGEFNATPQRGERLDWVVTLDWSGFTEDGTNRIRIELFQQ